MTTREDIIRMARECGMEQDGDEFFSPGSDVECDVNIVHIERFHALAIAAHEREKAGVQPKETAMQKYLRLGVEKDEQDPLERLRAFCSFAMNGQDWLDVEPLFDVVKKAGAQENIPRHLDVRKILLDVTPGEDGMGQEHYATCVADVQAVLTDMAERLENYAWAQALPYVDRGDAVNLARNVLENKRYEAHAVTPKGVAVLADAVLRMDAVLLGRTEPAARVEYLIEAEWPDRFAVPLEVTHTIDLGGGKVGIRVKPHEARAEILNGGAQALREAAETALIELTDLPLDPSDYIESAKNILRAALRGQGGCAVCGSDKCVAGECNDSTPIGINGLTEAETAASASVMGLTKKGTNQ